MKPKIKVMVDSGAFSAWRSGKSIDLDAYCAFIENNGDWIDSYVNLDVIIPSDPEAAAKASFDNLLTMRARGLRPIPVIHVRESFDWLQRVLDLGCDYTGLSATSIAERLAIDRWYEMAWSYLVDSSGNPLVKVHAFGDGREAALSRFPWHSADSATWINGQIYGWVFLPDGQTMYHRQKVEYSRRTLDITLLDGFEKQEFDGLLSQLGLDISAFAERKGRVSMLARSMLSAHYYGEVERRIRECLPIRFYPRRGLFNETHSDCAVGHPQKQFYLHLAISSNTTLLPCLYHAGYTSILFSFFFDSEVLRNSLRTYCRDPLAAIEMAPYNRHHTMLKEITSHARI